MADTYDVVVIGGGPGGYTAAIRAAQLGFSTACIDDGVRADGKPALGGTCTNVGCIPSKALLQSSEHFEHATHGLADHGIVVNDVAIDVAKMLTRKDKVVAQNNDGIAYLFKKNKIASFNGKGAFTGRSQGDGGYTIAVSGAKPASLVARNVIIATGSTPRALPRAGDTVGAEATRRGRRRRRRPRNGQRVAAPWRRRDDPRGVACAALRG